MQTKTSIRIIVKTNNFLKRHLSGCNKWSRKVLANLGLGILKSGSLQLSQICRSIKHQNQDIQVVENSLSRHLKNERWDENTILKSYLEFLKPYIRHDTAIYIDLTDYAKPYAKKLEKIGFVWDGSKKETVSGYWGFESIADLGEGELMPLVNFPYYLGEPVSGYGFISQNTAIEYGFDRLVEFFDHKGIWIEDRGFDSNRHFRYKQEHQIKFITRIRRNRILLDQENHSLGNVEDIVRKAELKGRLYYNNMTKQGEHEYLSVGSVRVRIPEVEGEYSLVIVRDDQKMHKYGGKTIKVGEEENEWFIGLITNLVIETPSDDESVVRKFLKRWGIEDGCRFIKQELGTETFLVRSFRGIRRLIMLSYILMGLLCLIYQMGKRAIKYLEGIGDCFSKDIRFFYYRIIRGLRKVLLTIRPP